MVPCKSTAEEVTFEHSHHRIFSTYSKVRTTLHVFITTDSVIGSCHYTMQGFLFDVAEI